MHQSSGDLIKDQRQETWNLFENLKVRTMTNGVYRWRRTHWIAYHRNLHQVWQYLSLLKFCQVLQNADSGSDTGQTENRRTKSPLLAHVFIWENYLDSVHTHVESLHVLHVHESTQVLEAVLFNVQFLQAPLSGE